MPVIPTFQRRVAEQDAPSVRVQANATPDMYGSQMGHVMRVGGEIAQQQADKMDTAAVIQADNQLRQKTTEFLYGDVFKREGAAARDVDKVFDTQYQAMQNETRQGLSGRAQQIFDQRASQYKSSLYPELQRHMTKQAEVALNDAYTGGVYTDARELSQDGAFLNTDRVSRMMANGDVATTALYAGRDPAFISAKKAERSNLVLTSALKTLHDQGDTEGAKKFIEIYGGKMDPRSLAPFQGWVKEKDKDNAVYADAAAIYTPGGDLAAMIAKAQNLKGGGVQWSSIKATAEKQMGKSYQLGGDGKSTTDCGLFTQEVFQGNGVNLGSRDVSEQARMLSDGGKFFTDKAQLKPGDLVFYKNTYQPTEGHGFQNITHAGIYAGDGKIIHAGSTKDENGNTGVRYADISLGGAEIAGYGHAAAGSAVSDDPAYKEKVTQRVIAMYNRDKAVKANQEHEELVRVNNALVGSTDPNARIDIWKNSGLQPYQIENGIKAELNSIKSSKDVLYQLDVAHANGTLTQDDVRRAAPYLTGEDQNKYSLKVVEKDAKLRDEGSRDADKRILQDLESAFSTQGTGPELREQKQSAWQVVQAQLDRENIKGPERYSRGMEIMRDSKLISDGKGSKDAVKSYVALGRADMEERGRLVRDFGENIVRLTEAGFVRSGLRNDPAMSWQMNQFLSSIGKQIQGGDSKAQSALDLLVTRGLMITPESYRDAYAIVQRGH